MTKLLGYLFLFAFFNGALFLVGAVVLGLVDFLANWGIPADLLTTVLAGWAVVGIASIVHNLRNGGKDD